MYSRSFSWTTRLNGAIAGVALLMTGTAGRAQYAPVQYQNPATTAAAPAVVPAPAAVVPSLVPNAPIAAEQPAAAPLNSADSPAIRALIRDEIKVMEADKKKADDAKKKEDEEKGFRVGSNLNMTARWDPSSGVTFETPNKDFRLHVGGRFQEDTVWFNQTPALRAPAQVGDLEDGTFFRRVRVNLDGVLWEVIEFNMEYAPEQVTQLIPNLDEFWVGVTKLPIIGNVRVGHLKVPQGFEGDMVSSSKAMTFMERSAYTDAFYQNFAPGVWFGNAILDQRATWSSMWYRQENNLHGSTGADFGDGEYAWSGRVTGLPIYENEGRHLLHLGVSASYRNAEKADPGLTGNGFTRFRARPQMRDAQGDFANAPLPGDSIRWVDTGNIITTSNTVIGTELFYVRGPFSVQSEWGFAYMNGAIVNGVNRGNLGFNGGYLECSYFLTGENRIYDRRLGRLGTTYIASPFTPFWATRDEDGRLNIGWGAIELATRWNYLNLNDGPVKGGIMDGFEAGINWYLTTNVKVQFEYLLENRFELKAGQINGSMNGFGTRVQLFF